MHVMDFIFVGKFAFNYFEKIFVWNEWHFESNLMRDRIASERRVWF